MLHARTDYNRIQDPAIDNPELLSEGSTPIGEDEPVFLVRASDQAFVGTVKEWIRLHSIAGGDSKMCYVLSQHIKRAEIWQQENGQKVADMPFEAGDQ